MTPITKAVVAFLATAALLAAGSPKQRTISDAERSAIEQAVLDANRQATIAAENLDADRLFGVMMENDKGSVVRNGNLALTRQQALEQVQNGFRGLQKLQYQWTRQLVSVISPTVAVLVAEGKASATTVNGDLIENPFVQTSIFVLSDGKWKILHSHQSSEPRR